MPELPEVETTRRGVEPHVVGRRIAALCVYDSRLRWPVPADLAERMAGDSIVAVDRRSKYLLFRLSRGTLLVHLGMTGSLRVHHHPPARSKHDHVDLVFDDGSLVRYNDPRRFGAMLWIPATDGDHPLLRDLGPEPFDAAFDARHFWNATRGRRAAVKLVLMDNRVVVGVGNIYANESLFRAGIRPATQAGRVSLPRYERLVTQVRAVLSRGDRQGRQHAARLRGRQRRTRVFSARLFRLRAGGPALPGLRHANPAPAAGRPGHVSLSAMPTVTPGRAARAGDGMPAGRRLPCRRHELCLKTPSRGFLPRQEPAV